jgi:hypothetical protein
MAAWSSTEPRKTVGPGRDRSGVADIGRDVMARAKCLVNRERADRSRSSPDDDLRRPSPFEKPGPSGVTMRDDRRTLPEQRWAIY